MSAKILHIDIETAPHMVYAWGLWKQDIRTNNIIEPGYTLCFAAKWQGKKDLIFRSCHHHGREEMIRTAHDLIEEADAVCHYNGTKFDMPILNQEFMLQGLNPPSPTKQIDLLKTARQRFKLPSNKLDYVAQVLGFGGKVKHKGMELWHDCMAGDDKAWRVMERYNKRDVRLLEKVYKKLMPWIVNHPNMALYKDNITRPVCTNCGSTHVHSRGIEHTKTMSYRRFQCQNCGNWMRSRKNITSDEHKEHTLVSVK